MYRFTTATKKLLGDLHTPVSLYLKLRDVYPQSALLESSDYHGGENSLSFIAFRPVARIGVNNGEALLEYPDGRSVAKPLGETYAAADALKEFLNEFRVDGDGSELCGLFGYTAFDAVRYFENIPVREFHHRDSDAPDICYILYKFLLVFDHFKNELSIVELCADGERDHIREVETLIEDRNFASYNFRTVGERRSNLTDETYREMVRQGVRHCLRGDVFQIVLSRRFEQPFQGDDFKVYRALRSINPSPYLFYFDFGGFRIFGSSPETHCKVEDGRATIDPIAGTAFRSGNSALDRERTERLLADPKENAEHVMLVDLARNDLSRNCTDVKVEFFKETQYYSHVIHLVSRVNGRLRPGTNPFRLLGETFPAGTLSGAPKVKALELILRYEPHDRGAYGGCIGFIGLDGSFNQAITIRSFVSRAGELWFQAGGGIVAASNEEYELQEVNNKLGALRKAILEAEHVSQ